MKAYPEEIKQEIFDCKQHGMSGRSIAKLLGLSKSGVNNYLATLDGGYKQKALAEMPCVEQGKGPRVLLFDLESTPSLVATFGRFKQNIGLNAVIREGGWLLSAAWKFLDEDKVHSVVLTPEEAIAGDDSRIVATLYELFEQSDWVVAHNLLQFDLPLFRTRLIMHGFPMHKTVKSVDTLQIAKKLKFNSNKLDGLAQQLGLSRKMENSGMPLWLDCIQGKPQALSTMQTYNEQDVTLLEEVYLQLRAFNQKSPNAAHYHNDDKVRCHVCGSDDVELTGHSVFTAASEFAEVSCKHCGTRSRTRINSMTQAKRKVLLSNIV